MPIATPDTRLTPNGPEIAPIGGVRRLNWGCGEHVAPGWINSDIKEQPGVDLPCDILKGLPLENDSIDYAVSIHALPELSLPDVVPALEELRRVLVPGGVLRLALPDLRKAMRAYILERDDFFLPGQEPPFTSRGGRFISHILWFGYTKTLFTKDFAEELMRRAGFIDIHHCRLGETRSIHHDITALDNRPSESLFIEASKPPMRRIGRLRLGRGNRMKRRVEVEVVRVVQHAADEPSLRGGHVNPFPSPGKKTAGLTVWGWVVGRDHRPLRVLASAGEQTVAEAAVNLPRPDLKEHFRSMADVDTAGFELILEPDGYGASRLEFVVELGDGSTARLAEVDLRVRRRRPWSRS